MTKVPNKAIGAAFSVVVVVIALAIIPATRDEIHWLWASHKGDTASYERYVQVWPVGRRAVEAKTRLESLHWQEVIAADTVTRYQDYIRLHSDGPHLREAETTAAALLGNDELFNEASRTGTEASLRKFLEDFPGHQQESEAQQALKDIVEGRDIVDLLSEKKIEVRTQGSGIQNVTVRIRKLVPYPITIRVPVGTYFVSSRRSAQNMVTAGESTLRLTADDWQQVSVSAACANRPRDIPRSADTFTVQRSPHQKELARLMPVLNKAGVDYATRQAAVWIVTDDASYSELGILVARRAYQSGGTRTIREAEAAAAMKICDEAGIDVTRKRIWADRRWIIQGLKDGESRKWLDR